MPKAKTSTKRTTSSSSKKASNKSSSGKGLSKRFSLQSRKVQFFVFIFVVALLGGGWFTYRSFAGNSVVYSGGNLQPTENSTRVVDTTKNSAAVIKMPYQSGASATDKGTNNLTKQLITNGSTYKVCVSLKASSPGRIRIKPLLTKNAIQDISVSGGSYNNYCTQNFVRNQPDSLLFGAAAYINNLSGSTQYLFSVEFVKVASAPPPVK